MTRARGAREDPTCHAAPRVAAERSGLRSWPASPAPRLHSLERLQQRRAPLYDACILVGVHVGGLVDRPRCRPLALRGPGGLHLLQSREFALVALLGRHGDERKAAVDRRARRRQLTASNGRRGAFEASAGGAGGISGCVWEPREDALKAAVACDVRSDGPGCTHCLVTLAWTSAAACSNAPACMQAAWYTATPPPLPPKHSPG
eukprot:352210-Chlamydomonas_euryale.AAC.5